MSQPDDGLSEHDTSFAKQEPVVLRHLLSGPITGLVVLLAPGSPGSAAEQITAGVVTLLIVMQGFLIRRVVTPAWKRHRPSPIPKEQRR